MFVYAPVNSRTYKLAKNSVLHIYCTYVHLLPPHTTTPSEPFSPPASRRYITGLSDSDSAGAHSCHAPAAACVAPSSRHVSPVHLLYYLPFVVPLLYVPCTFQAVGGDVLEGLKEMSGKGVTPDEATLLGTFRARVSV